MSQPGAEAGLPGKVGEGAGQSAQPGVLYVQEGVMQGPSGEQYVTIIQDGQTYAIPATDYAAMIAQQEDGPATLPTSSEAKSNEPQLAASAPVQPTAPASVAAPDLASPPSPPMRARKSTEPGLSMQWMAGGTGGSGQKQQHPQQQHAGVAGEPRSHLYPTIQEVIRSLPDKVSSPPKKNYKPIRVDNWGIFLLSRLQNYFQKKEFCDLSLRFPSKNAQIKVHKLVLNACTDYFCQQEKEGKLIDGAIDMPANFTPESVAPIIRFMYTGKIDLKEGSYKKLYDTAEVLQMSVLTKLMSAQINNPDSDPGPDRRPAKRRNSGAFEDDPVEQIRKIRRIEKRVAGQQVGASREAEPVRLPGRKLNIWKRAVPEHAVPPVARAQPQHKQFSPDKTAAPDLHGYKIPKFRENPFLSVGSSESVGAILDQEIEDSRARDDCASTRHIKIEPVSGQLIPTPHVGTTYTKRSPGDKAKIPRRLQEIQQHLMFEKILKSGSKNTVVKKAECNTEKANALSIDEVKELVEEQKQRMATISQDDEDEEYYNNDTVDIGDDFIENVDSPAAVSAEDLEALEAAETDFLTVAKDESSAPAAQTQVLAEPEAQKKTIRFSLRPSSKPQIMETLAGTETEENKKICQSPAQVPQSPLSGVETSKANLETSQAVTCSSSGTLGKPLHLVPVSPPFSLPGGGAVGEGRAGPDQQQQLSLPLPPAQLQHPQRNDLDEALEEFSRVAEEEAAELSVESESGPGRPAQPPAQARPGSSSSDQKKPRRGRPPRWLKEQTLQMGEMARKKQSVDNQEEASIDLKPQNINKTEEKAEVKSEPPVSDQSQVINEVLKKYPNLFKENKAVKIKVLAKDASGKSVTKFITLRAQAPSSPVPAPVGMGGFRPIQKVMYTGRRGRPKKVKPGEFDPHQEERRQIEERLVRDFPQLASQISLQPEEAAEEEVEEVDRPGGSEQYGAPTYPVPSQSHAVTLDPSSEAEALTTVAGGIAASLGLGAGQEAAPSNQQVILPALDPTTVPHYQPGQALVMENGQIHIMAGPSPGLVTMDQSQHKPADFFQNIQIITTDGQLQRLEGVSQAGSALPLLAPRLLPAVGPGIMTWQPASPSPAMVPVSTHMLHTTGLQHPPPLHTQSHLTPAKAVNKIVSDWESEEESQD